MLAESRSRGGIDAGPAMSMLAYLAEVVDAIEKTVQRGMMELGTFASRCSTASQTPSDKCGRSPPSGS